MVEKTWWEQLLELDKEAIEMLSKVYPDYKNYEKPTLDMRMLVDSFIENKFLNKEE